MFVYICSLYRLDIPKACLGEKGIYFIHLRKQRANVVVSISLVNDYLPKQIKIYHRKSVR